MITYVNGVPVLVPPAVHGVDKHTDVTRDLFIPAAEAFIGAGAIWGVGTYSCVYGTANADAPSIYFDIKVPSDFVSFISVKAKWSCAAAAGNMRWKIAAKYAAAGQLYTAHEETPDNAVTATGGTNIFNVQEPANALSLASLVKDDYLGLFFFRNGAHAEDTLEDFAYVYGLIFTYVAEQ